MRIKKIIFKRADNLKIEMKELRGLIPGEEYQEFLAKCFDVKLKNAVEEAEDIIRKKRS